MSYIALYREWRPKTFKEIMGQDHITRTLKNQIQQGRISHAYLFCGTRGTGKTTTSKVFAKAINCLDPKDGEPCGKCEICLGVDAGNLLDVIEMDAASNRRVDDARDLVDNVKMPPYKAKYKVYIVDEVHMLTTEAFNTLLKTLEEPPSYAVFILATTSFEKVPATIVSRCQRFDFKRIRTDDIITRLRIIADDNNISVENKTLSLIARSSDGALRDSLSIFDQCISMSGKDIKYQDVVSMLGISTDEYLIKLADSIAAEDTVSCISLIDELIINGKDVYQFIKDFIMHFRNLMICKIGDNASDILNVSDEFFGEFKIQSKKFSTESLLRNINILSAAEADAKWTAQPRIILEMAVLRMCRKELDTDVDALLERIERLESALKGNATIAQSQDTKEIRKIESEKTVIKEPVRKTEAVKVETIENLPAVSLQDIEKKWKDILRAISNGGHKRLYAFMLEGKPAGVTNNILTISYEKNYEFHKRGLEESDNRKIAEEYIANACGCKLYIKCIINDEIAADKQEDDIVQKAISIFGEDMVEVEE
ncbi:DNA polymerase III subunit tau [Oxobacter pfennigii]|uniref:DNA-directed DNA polymerase n=1 Tax=Oxobacter pfennigii TaxID=36849 RepID=A0A0P8YF82_9CLOT|nr:DNA polymerase III subunit gamma/tau [Oxobacter pfennigii]KPU45785.1 DNA polymerase III subunit tau [Oxobacter pfennigii]